MLHDFDRCVKAGFVEHAARFLDGEDHLGLLEGLTGLDAVAEAAEVILLVGDGDGLHGRGQVSIP